MNSVHAIVHISTFMDIITNKQMPDRKHNATYHCSIVKLSDFAYNIRKGGKGDQYEKNDADWL